MNYLYAYLITVLFSFGASTINELRMYKNFANNRYKLDSETINKSKFRKENKIPINMSLLILIPIINVLNTIKNVFYYEINQERIYNDLKKIFVTEKMTDEESKIYEEFPLGLTSRLLNVRENNRLSDCTKIKLDDNSKIYYRLDDEGQFEIEKVTGQLSNKSISEQIEALRKYREELLKQNNIELNNTPRIRVKSKKQ